MQRTRRHRALVAAGAALLIASGTVTLRPLPAEAATPVRVIQYNICGSICHHGVIDRPGPNNDIVEDVRNRVLGVRPAILTLNEICIAQFNRLKALLSTSAWKMSGVFRPQRNDGRCKAGTAYGDAVFSAGAAGGTVVLPMPNLGGERRAVLCLRTTAGGPVLACTLHLVTGRSKHGAREKFMQMAAASRALNARAAEGAVIVGGDFNLMPAQMGSLLNGARGGRFFEADPEMAGTHGRKIDYILFSRAHFSNPSGGPQASKSDHKVLIGQATRH